MNGGDQDHGMGGMGGMGMSPPPSPASMANATGGHMMPNHHMLMHMTFFWGKDAEILFSGWPGYHNLGMYLLALVFVFFLAVLVEWLSHCNLIKEGTHHLAAGIIQTVLYTLRIGLAYLVMLALMSYNAGVFLVAIAGHALGFLIFGSRVFKKPAPAENPKSDLPLIGGCQC